MYEIGAGSNFFGKSDRTEFKGIGKGIFSRSDKEFWLGCLQLLARLKFFLVPKNLYHLNKLDGIYIKDAFAIGWSPNFWWSPVRHSRFFAPSAAAPRRSLCRAIRFLSRQVIWIIGSNPASRTIRPAAMLDMRTTAV